jgi:hypothetical protein
MSDPQSVITKPFGGLGSLFSFPVFLSKQSSALIASGFVVELGTDSYGALGSKELGLGRGKECVQAAAETPNDGH